MSTEPPARRVAVSRPLRPQAATTGGTGAAKEIDEQTALGETYMRSLVRTQLRLGLAALASVFVPLALLPAVWALAPQIAELSVGPVPLAWVVLGIAVYPTLVLVGWRYVRQAERNEAEFVRIVSRR